MLLRVYNGGKTISSKSGAGKTGQQSVKEIRTLPNAIYTQKHSKWIKYINVKLDTLKLLEENRQNILFINCSNILLDLSPRVMEIKTKINKWDLIKLKSLLIAKKP